MPQTLRRLIATAGPVSVVTVSALMLAACAGGTSRASKAKETSTSAVSKAPTASRATPRPSPTSTVLPGHLTIAFAGDVHFAERTLTRLQANPATAFGDSAAVLSKADVTMVNLETAIAVGGRPESKSFTFQAPPSALTALKDAGIDLATMANNHAADFGAAGLAQTLSAIKASKFPVIGIGASAAQAYAPYYLNVNGVKLAFLAASQVQEETLARFTATPTSAGIASAYSDRLVAAVRQARAQADLVIVYLHWGTEYQSCPNADQRSIADTLAAAGADAVVGTHAHVLQGAGWRPDGKFVAYGLGNYFWWRSFGNDQDDNGVLTLTVTGKKIVSSAFEPSQLDNRGIGVPANGANRARILTQWDQARRCSGLAASKPR